MTSIAARSPGLRVARNIALAWLLLSLLGLAAAIVFTVYGAGAVCPGFSNGIGDWIGCAIGFSTSIIAALVSIFASAVVLLFAQLFYMAGATVRTARAGRVGIGDELLDAAVDVID